MRVEGEPKLGKSQSVRQRITPTYIHHNIFGSEDQDQVLNVRYSATFASTVFDLGGYAVQTKHSRTLKPAGREGGSASQAFVGESQK